MSAYSEDLIALIDQRINLARRQDRANGTIVTRATTGSGATATFDGSVTPVVVKVAGNVYASTGDRVLLARHGSDWIVTESFSSLGYGENNRVFDSLPSATGALTSSTFVDLTEFGVMQFSKNFDATFLRVQLQAQCFVTGAAARVAFAGRLTPISGADGYTPVDMSLGTYQINAVAQHVNHVAMRRWRNIPAGTYNLSIRWRRNTGSGMIFMDTNDGIGVEMDERVSAAIPVL